jgi:hypothetical protein
MSANKCATNIHQKYVCDICDYECSKKSSWSQHLLTSKHQRANLGLMPANKEVIADIKKNARMLMLTAMKIRMTMLNVMRQITKITVRLMSNY